jgi:RNA polymerase sigma-70 factor (ECF subfamily)
MSIAAAKSVYTQEVSELVAGCLEGEQAAYAALYRRFAADVYRLVYGLLGDTEDAEEVLQDAFLYAMHNLARYDPARAGLRTWLFRIAVCRARNKRRRKILPTISLADLVDGGRERVELKSAARPAEESAQRASDREELISALNCLTPKLREAAVLRYFEGLTSGEIGQVLGVPPKTAESRVRLAHVALRRLLEERKVLEPGTARGGGG